ncbi:Bor protein [Thiovulum sp. ES]|nr:Bor protein [Thiovulum sp. ES]
MLVLLKIFLEDKKLKKSNIAFLFLTAFLFTSCSKVTVVAQNPKSEIIREPDFQRSENYFFWGLAGEHHYNTTSICNNGVEQIRTEKTFGDGFFTLITLGIYSPHSAKIWCKGE